MVYPTILLHTILSFDFYGLKKTKTKTNKQTTTKKDQVHCILPAHTWILQEKTEFHSRNEYSSLLRVMDNFFTFYTQDEIPYAPFLINKLTWYIP